MSETVCDTDIDAIMHTHTCVYSYIELHISNAKFHPILVYNKKNTLKHRATQKKEGKRRESKSLPLIMAHYQIRARFPVCQLVNLC